MQKLFATGAHMKISAMPHGGTPGVNINNSSNSDRNVTAKAIFAGEASVKSEIPVDSQQHKVNQDIRRIKMKTNASPDRFTPKIENEVESAKIPINEQSQVVVEQTNPLDPQVAAFAKQRRSLQVKERELADREAAIISKTPTDGSPDIIARLKSEPLSVLQEYGVTYDQLTEAILADKSNINPEIFKLREELKALKEGVDKNLSDRDTQAEQQVLREMRKEADSLVNQDDTYPLVKATNMTKKAIELIHCTYKETGEVLEVSSALQLIEDDLFKENLKLANLDKIKNAIFPAQPAQQQRQNTIRTLTNRDSSSVGLSRRERAMMAANGILTKG